MFCACTQSQPTCHICTSSCSWFYLPILTHTAVRVMLPAHVTHYDLCISNSDCNSHLVLVGFWSLPSSSMPNNTVFYFRYTILPSHLCCHDISSPKLTSFCNPQLESECESCLLHIGWQFMICFLLLKQTVSILVQFLFHS